MDAVLGKVSGQLEVGADVEGLALGLGVGVVALDVAVTGEAVDIVMLIVDVVDIVYIVDISRYLAPGVGGRGVDGVVLAGHAGDDLAQRLHRVDLLSLGLLTWTRAQYRRHGTPGKHFQ